jgi:hypothetical protein
VGKATRRCLGTGTPFHADRNLLTSTRNWMPDHGSGKGMLEEGNPSPIDMLRTQNCHEAYPRSIT